METVYRIENPDTMHGMWYKLDGTWAPVIFNLSEGISKDLPMEYHPRYALRGRKWFFAGKSIENMNQWFSPQDAWELHLMGYKLYRFDVEEFQMEEYQCLFTREGIVTQEQIPLEVVFDLSGFGHFQGIPGKFEGEMKAI